MDELMTESAYDSPIGTQQSQHTVAVVVPQYREELTADEAIALRHIDHFLPLFDRYVVVPKDLANSLRDFEPRRFPSRYFRSRVAYSALLLSPSFYRAFEQYEYILVHQLDSLVLSDRLLEWCTGEFDFVGAPGLFVSWPRAEEIRNGGLSLRRIEAFLGVLESREPWMKSDAYWERYWSHRSFAVRALNLPRRYVKGFHRFNGVRWETSRWERGTNTSRTVGANEDFFWSLEATRYRPDFTIAPADVALRFAFEANPRICYERTGRTLPFGCHGWARYDRSFWEMHLLQAA